MKKSIFNNALIALVLVLGLTLSTVPSAHADDSPSFLIATAIVSSELSLNSQIANLETLVKTNTLTDEMGALYLSEARTQLSDAKFLRNLNAVAGIFGGGGSRKTQMEQLQHLKDGAFAAKQADVCFQRELKLRSLNAGQKK